MRFEFPPPPKYAKGYNKTSPDTHSTPRHSHENSHSFESPVIQTAYPRALKLLTEKALDPNSFRGFYTNESIDADIAYTSLRESQFKSDEMEKTALVLEGIFYEHLKGSDWLGKGVETTKTSRFDDIKHGVDLIAEFSIEGFTKHLALGIDVTFNSMSLGKKFAKIKEEIDKDTLTLVKYFDSHSHRGELKNTPRTIIGVEKNTVTELAALWVRNQNTELANHFVQDIVAREILEQLQVFLMYAKSIGAENAERSYTQAMTMLTTVLKKKAPIKRQPIDMKRIDGDRVYLAIQSQLEAFKPASKTT